jgi:hypothetical protein
MPNSEDYTVVWAGMCRTLREDEVASAEAGTHPLIVSARSLGLEYRLDTFGTVPQGGPLFHLLIGSCLDTLGYKEGRSQLLLFKDQILARLEGVEAALGKIGYADETALHVLLRIQG